MDFALTEEQEDLRGLIARILADRMTLERLKTIERSGDGWDRDTWTELAAANLVAATVPEADGGLGFGFLEACVLLREQGRAVAPVPLMHALIGGLALAEFGSAEDRMRLAAIADGSAFPVVAFAEYGAEPSLPEVEASVNADGWRVDGVKTAVPLADVADVLFVPAARENGEVVVLVVDPQGGGVELRPQKTMNHEPQFEVAFEGARAVGVLGEGVATGRSVLDWLLARCTVAYCAIAAGVADRALRLTAEYTTQRKQFDRPIGSFQAVGQRMAESYIDATAIELTMLAAASHLDEGREVPLEVGTAKFWAADGGSRVVHAALHVHGGISIDIDFPIHRYFLWMKQIENTLGGATPQLLGMGRELAAL